MGFTYEYARAALTVDCVVFGLDEESLKVALVQRALDPFRGSWALPGGFVHVDETVDEAARRELEEEAGLSRVFLEQLYTFGELDRDPRERVVSVAYYALVKLSDHRVRAATDARAAAWFPARKAPRLAFDHARILATGLARLEGKVRYKPIGFELLPPRFTLTQLQRMYEVILQRSLDKRNFRKKILATGVIEALEAWEEGVAHRAARLFRFDRRRYELLEKRGFNFEI